ncbi:DNA processing protein DprA [Apilactobacillus kunkeei]|uniref:DNA processing protein DprA n=1 Tax=Apilactobacillus kunkeei TaxID=148814 RepID=UPI000697C0DF|nr:DNA processing protein DprA [Apilactobacillus kunkeei]
MSNITRVVLALTQIKGIGNQTIIKGLSRISLNDISDNFTFLTKINSNKIQKKLDDETLSVTDWHNALSLADDIINKSKEKGISTVSFLDEDYPKNLLMVHDEKYPAILYFKGDITQLNSHKTLAVVGTRNITDFGSEMTSKYVKYFTSKDYVIVSGLAKGIDAKAHEETIRNGGKTIAILAAGLDQTIYPKENYPLAKEILRTGGALISEYKIGTKLFPQFLAARDKWQTGISDGVIAIETGVRGGTKNAMIAAGYQKRPLGCPDAKEYLDVGFDKLPKTLIGTEEYIEKGLAIPLYTNRSVKGFRLHIEEEKERRNQNFREEESVEDINLF